MRFFASRAARARDNYLQGKRAADAEDFDLALSFFNEAMRVDPSSPLGFLGRGFVHLKRWELAAAIADFSEVIRLEPAEAHAYFYRSLCYEGLGDHPRQIADHAAALALDPAVAGEARPRRADDNPTRGRPSYVREIALARLRRRG